MFIIAFIRLRMMLSSIFYDCSKSRKIMFKLIEKYRKKSNVIKGIRKVQHFTTKINIKMTQKYFVLYPAQF